MAAEKQHQTDADAQENDVVQESFELLVSQDGERTPCQGKQEQGEIAARQHHEYGDDNLRVVGKSPDARSACGEAARADGAHRVAKGIVKIHVAPVEQQGLQQREEQVDKPNAFHGVHDSRV